MKAKITLNNEEFEVDAIEIEHLIPKKEWIKVPKLNIEIESKVHDLGISFKDVKIHNGCRLLNADEALIIANNEALCTRLSLKDYCIYIRQYNESKASWLGCDDNNFYIYAYYYLYNDGAARGVLFCRDLKE